VATGKAGLYLRPTSQQSVGYPDSPPTMLWTERHVAFMPIAVGKNDGPLRALFNERA